MLALQFLSWQVSNVLYQISIKTCKLSSTYRKLLNCSKSLRWAAVLCLRIGCKLWILLSVSMLGLCLRLYCKFEFVFCGCELQILQQLLELGGLGPERKGRPILLFIMKSVTGRSVIASNPAGQAMQQIAVIRQLSLQCNYSQPSGGIANCVYNDRLGYCIGENVNSKPGSSECSWNCVAVKSLA